MRLLSSHSGFGKVYEAYERSTPKILKVLKENHVHDDKVLNLFRQEAMVLSQLSHPGIPQVEADGYFQYSPRQGVEPLHCLMMEKVDGPNLSQWMQQQGNHPISEKQALQWLHQLVEVLHLVHHKNYFHRDIKPENIMLRSGGQLVLVDFGAVREITQSYYAHLGSPSGVTAVSSAGYSAPEQEQGQAVPQSDFYALGRTFVYLLTAKHPTDRDIYNSFTNEFSWREYAPQISGAFADLVDTLIAPRASDRPSNTQVLLDWIMRLEQQKNTPATALQPAPPIGLPTTQLTARDPRDRWVLPSALRLQTSRRYRRSYKVVATGGALVLALVAGFGGWQAYQLISQPTQSIGAALESQQVSLIKTLPGHTNSVNAIVLHPDAQTLMSGSADKTIKIWNLTTGAEIRTLSGATSFINTLALSSDGQILMSGDANGQIIFWNWATGERRQILSAGTGAVNSLVVVIRPDGERLISATATGVITIWDLSTGKSLQTLTGHTGPINDLKTTPAGLLASASADKTIRLWNMDSGEMLGVLKGHSSYVNTLIFSPDGQLLMSGSADKTIKIWNVSEQKLLRTLKGHQGYVNTLQMSQDGQTFLSGSTDGTIHYWDVNTGQLKKTLSGFERPVDQLLVRSQDQLITINRAGDSTIRLWRVP